MYQVSSVCKALLESGQYKGTIRGTVGNVAFTAQNIARNSLTITNQCSGNANIGIGQVYVGQLTATFQGLAIPDTAWNGKAITLYAGIELAGGTVEEIPLGVFYVTGADKTLKGMQVSAYDAMYLMDRRCDTSLFIGSQTAYTWASLMATNCGLTLGTTSTEFAAMVNGTAQFTLSDSSAIETWRDAMSWLSECLCCFVTAGRDGKIYFKPYHRTADDTFTPAQRFNNCSFSDFVTSYSTIYFTNADGTESEYSLGTSGLIYEGGKNPFLLEDAESMRNAVCLGLCGTVAFTPFTASILTNPIYDLGDILSFTDGIADGTRLYCVTKIIYKYGTSTKLQGVGSNPKLAGARSRESKAVAAVEKETAANTQTIINTQGAVAILDSKVTEIAGNMLAEHIYPYGMDVNEVTDTDQQGTPNNVLIFRFNSEADGNVFDFHGLLTFNVHTFTKNVTEGGETTTYYQDGLVRVRYLHGTKADGSDWAPVATFYQAYGDGARILTLNHNLHPVSEGEHFFIVELQATGASLYSMAVITAYLFGGKKMGPVEMLTLGEPSLDPAWTGDGSSSTLADWVEAILSSDYTYYWGTTPRDSGSVQRDPFVALDNGSVGMNGWIALFILHMKVDGVTYNSRYDTITLELVKEAIEALKAGDESAYIDLGIASTGRHAYFDYTPPHNHEESWINFMCIGCTDYLEGGIYVWLAKVEAETATTLPLFLSVAEADAFIANPTAATLAPCINGDL